MKVQDIARVEDTFARLVQATRFLRSMERAELQAMKIRDLALLDMTEEMSYAEIGKHLGVSRQRVGQLVAQARKNMEEIYVVNDD